MSIVYRSALSSCQRLYRVRFGFVKSDSGVCTWNLRWKSFRICTCTRTNGLSADEQRCLSYICYFLPLIAHVPAYSAAPIVWLQMQIAIRIYKLTPEPHTSSRESTPRADSVSVGIHALTEDSRKAFTGSCSPSLSCDTDLSDHTRISRVKLRSNEDVRLEWMIDTIVWGESPHKILYMWPHKASKYVLEMNACKSSKPVLFWLVGATNQTLLTHPSSESEASSSSSAAAAGDATTVLTKIHQHMVKAVVKVKYLRKHLGGGAARTAVAIGLCVQRVLGQRMSPAWQESWRVIESLW